MIESQISDTGRQTDRMTDKMIDRAIYGRTDGQTDRQPNCCCQINSNFKLMNLKEVNYSF